MPRAINGRSDDFDIAGVELVFEANGRQEKEKLRWKIGLCRHQTRAPLITWRTTRF
jgi:hypothetical protein